MHTLSAITATQPLLDWGWLKIGPPIYLNINPVLLQIGPIALRWYGLMYVVAILMGLWFIQGYCKRKGITQELVYRLLWWCIAAGIIGGRLYFVIQQDNLVDYYLKQPIHIIATWEGGMAFYGAIFLVIPTLIWRARVERVNPLVLIDAGVLFAAGAQIFGRIGNLINGDIIGYRNDHIPWATVYLHPDSWACHNPSTCGVPVEPAAGYEMLANIALLLVMLFLAKRFRRPGALMLVYLFGYAITQFVVFFARDNVIVEPFGLAWGLKQAQWTSLVVLIALLPITYLVMRKSRPVPEGETAITYGVTQKQESETAQPEDTEPKEGDEQIQEPDRTAENALEEPIIPDDQKKPEPEGHRTEKTEPIVNSKEE